MKTLIATLLALASSSSFAFAPTAALNHDPVTYRNVTQKAVADYKTATAKCAGMNGNDKDVCTAEAKAARARAEADAVAQYNNTEQGRAKSRTRLADADHDVAKARCGAMSGADKDNCMNNARAVHTTALADAKAGRDSSAASTAANKCDQLGGSARTGCLVENKTPVTAATGATTATGAELANRAQNAAERTVDKTKAAASAAAEKTRELAHTAVEKTKQAASTVAQKTGNAMERAGDKSREVASTAGEKTRDTAAAIANKTDAATDTAASKGKVAANKTAAAASDTAITTKVKANIFKEPDLKSMAIHVETDNGVVMLSGFVDSRAEAEKAVKVARGVDGVTTVKSAIKVK
jgi:hyperosmotically inducible protein